MISQGAFRVAILDCLNRTLPRFKPGGWKKCLDSMLALVEIRETLGTDQMVLDWVESMLQDSAVSVQSLTDATEDVADIFLGWPSSGFGKYEAAAVCESMEGGRIILRLRPLHRRVTDFYGARLSERPSVPRLMRQFSWS